MDTARAPAAASPPYRVHWTLKAASVLLGVGIGVFFTEVLSARSEPGVPASLVIQDTRICAAVAVYTTTTSDAWDMRAAIALASLNSFEAAGYVEDCGAPLSAVLAGRFVPLRWQQSLDAVDAVLSGSYLVPDACARATAVVPLPADAVAASPVAARAQCVIHDLAFVGVAP